VSCLGLALGPLIGGVLVSLWDWRGVFWLNVAAGVVLLVTGYRYVPESADPDAAPVDLPGQLLAIGAIAAIVVGLIQGERAGYAAGHIDALFAVGAVCLAGFIWRELATAAPMLDLRYFRRRRFRAALGVAFAAYFGTFSIFFFSALYLETVVHYTGYRTALLFLPMTACMVAGAVGGSRLVVRRGGRWTMALGAMLAAGGIAASEPLLNPHPSFAGLMVTLALTGLGMGTAMVPVTSVVLEVVPPEHSGMAASATNTARQLGVVFGVAILGALVNAHLTTDLKHRLDELGIPRIFQNYIIHAYEHGAAPNKSTLSGQVFASIVERIKIAAYAAFHDGLASALTISAILIAAAAAFAGYAAARSDDAPAATGD
jgi:predicted MFS family arabinose efflux permease